MKKTTIAALFLFVVMLAAGAAYAREIHDYNLIVPRFHGKDVTSTHLHKVNGSKGVDNNTSIGGGYTQEAAMFRGGTDADPTSARQVGPWKSIGSGDRILLSYYMTIPFAQVPVSREYGAGPL